jgi:transposase InsO family protein
MLNVVDEFTRQCLAIRVDRHLRSTDVIDVLSDLFILRGVPGHIRSDNGPEFVVKAVQAWIHAVGTKTAYIEPGSPLLALQSNACWAMRGRMDISRVSMPACATS